MNKLPKDFSLNKYGLHVRLVSENDAEFILSLRANPDRTKYMVTLKYDIDKQRKWIYEYKKREIRGLDYYFIYFNDANKPIGLYRISHIDRRAKKAKLSSWIAVNGLKYESIKMMMIGNEVAFNTLKIGMGWGETHKRNIRALRIMRLFMYDFNDVGTEFYHFSLSRDDFFKAYKKSIVTKFINE